MTIRLLVTAAVIAAPSVAGASPGPSPTVTFGVSTGITESDNAGLDGFDAADTIGLFGRINLHPRIAAQLDIVRTTTAEISGINQRSATALLMIDLLSFRRVTALVLGGTGMNWGSDHSGGSQGAHHYEAGLALEVRTGGGFLVGLDMRIGGLGLDHSDLSVGLTSYELHYIPASLYEGPYRSARLYAGVRF